MRDERRYWFHAKRYGWGWGIPATWQGWLVLAAYLALLVGGAYVEPVRAGPGRYPIYAALITAALVAVVVLKGERPLRWRWGQGGKPPD